MPERPGVIRREVGVRREGELDELRGSAEMVAKVQREAHGGVDRSGGVDADEVDHRPAGRTTGA